MTATDPSGPGEGDAAGALPPPGSGPPGSGPPGGAVFSLEGRPAPGLYVVAWMLAGIGLALLFIATLSQAGGWRVALGSGGAASLGLGLAAGAGYQVLARRDRHPSRYRGPSPLLVFGVVLAMSTLTSSLLLGTGLLDPEQPFGFLAGLLIVGAAYLGCVWLFVVRSDALDWQQMGWPAPAPGRLRQGIRAAALGIAVMVPATFAITILANLVAQALHITSPDVLPTPSDSLEALAVAAAAAIVAPVGEEVFFRGFALSAWARDLGARGALVRSAVFFAVVHVVNVSAVTFAEGAGQAFLQVLVILPLGLLLGWLLLRGGLVAAILGHVTYNSLLLLVLVLRTVLPEAG